MPHAATIDAASQFETLIPKCAGGPPSDVRAIAIQIGWFQLIGGSWSAHEAAKETLSAST